MNLSKSGQIGGEPFRTFWASREADGAPIAAANRRWKSLLPDGESFAKPLAARRIWVDYNGREVGNGGHSQRTPKAHRTPLVRQ